MTIRDRSFWLFIFCFVSIAIVVWTSIFITLYHPTFELRASFAVLDTDLWSLSVQWPNGAVSFWLSSREINWRIWP